MIVAAVPEEGYRDIVTGDAVGQIGIPVDVFVDGTGNTDRARRRHVLGELGGVICGQIGCRGADELADGHHSCNRGIDGGVAAAISGDIHKTQIAFTFAIGARVLAGSGDGIGKKLNAERAAGVAVEAAGDGNVCTGGGGGCQHRIVLEVIVANVTVAQIIGGHIEAVFGAADNVDAEFRVIIDRVAGDGGTDGAVLDFDPGIAVAVNRVADNVSVGGILLEPDAYLAAAGDNVPLARI